ncbi:MAG: hypothetical protein ACE5KS_07825, partial [Woeseiaceae bacterium]
CFSQAWHGEVQFGDYNWEYQQTGVSCLLRSQVTELRRRLELLESLESRFSKALRRWDSLPKSGPSGRDVANLIHGWGSGDVF